MEVTMGTTEGAAKAARPMRADQVAVRLGITARRVTDLANEGRFPGAFQNTPGGPWQFPRAAVERYLEERAAVASARRS